MTALTSRAAVRGPAEDSPAGPAEAPSAEILKVLQLRKEFRHKNGGREEDLLVLDGVSFSVSEGEFVTIVGPSGCGKTTLLNIIAGMERYDEGVVTVTGRPVSSPGTDTVMVFQEDALFPWLTVSENVAFGLRSRGMTKEDREKVASRYVEMVQLGQFANSYMHQLSGGMKQRVAIARGLAMSPKVLLMDEPFGALDYRTREILQGQIRLIHEKTGTTILFVTHDVREAVSLGDRVILLSGRPARIKKEYSVDVPGPRNADDPRFQEVTKDIVRDLKEEVTFLDGSGDILAGEA